MSIFKVYPFGDDKEWDRKRNREREKYLLNKAVKIICLSDKISLTDWLIHLGELQIGPGMVSGDFISKSKICIVFWLFQLKQNTPDMAGNNKLHL